MVADVLIGLSLWSAASMVTALVLGRILQRGRTAARGGRLTAGTHAFSDVA
jgi:hypothetical protein